MIILHPATSVSFNTNGLGNLADYIDGIVVEEINGMFEVTVRYPIFGIHYNEITMRRILYCKPNPHSKPQPFRIYSISKPMNGVVTINAAHISYDLSGFPVNEFESTSPSDAFSKIKSNSILPIPFTFNSTVTSTGKVSVTAPRSARSIMGNNILRAFGGEYEFDNMMVYHTKSRGMDRGFSIRYGKNLLDVNQEENIANVYTGVYPYWIGETEDGAKVVVKLPEKIVKVEGTFDFQRILTYDAGEDMYEKPTEEQLRELTLKKIKREKIGIPSVSIDASFIQLSKSTEYKHFAMLEEVRLGDQLDVEFIKLGISAKARCIKTIYNIKTDSYNDLELGDAKSNLSTTISENNQIISETIAKQEQKFDAEIGSIKIDLAQIDKLIADKVDAQWVTANFAHLVNGYIDNAQIKDLNAGTITTGDLDAKIIKAGVIEAINMRVDSAVIEAAKIADLSADKITTGDLAADRIKAGVITAINISTENATIQAAKIGNLSADKITTGTLNADRIGAGTIDANKIAIGDFTNYAVAPTNAQHANVNGIIEKCYYIKNMTGFLLSNDKITTLEQNDKFLVKGNIFSVSGTTPPTIYFAWRNSEGVSIVSKGASIPFEVGKYKDFRVEVEIPTKPSLAVYGTFNLQSSHSSPMTGEHYFHNLSIMRKSNGELIVDGSITADKIAAGAITAGKIDADAITAELIKSKVIEAINLRTDNAVINSAKIGNIDATKITTGFLSADRIKAGTITADKIDAKVISSIEVNASKIVSDKITAGEIKVGDINIVDGSISFAKISNVKITNAMMDKAFVADAYIKSLDAGVIKAGTMEATRIKGGTLDASTMTVKNLKADSITAGSLTIQGENLQKNSTFFDGFNNWSKTEGDIFTIMDSVLLTDVKICMFRRTGLTASSSAVMYSGSRVIKAIPGETFIASAYIFIQDNYAPLDGDCNINIWFYDKDGAYINEHREAFNNIKKGSWVRRYITASAPANTGYVAMGVSAAKNGQFAWAKPMLSKGSIASEWKPHTDELISDGAINNDKLGPEAVTSDKIMTDELFVGDNAFIRKLKAIDIDAANITTGTISNERINIKGLISFDAFDKTLQPIFNVQGDKTYINGGMIATNTIKADKIDLLSGLTVQGANGKPVFNISRVGDTDTGAVEIDGLLKSGNFDEDKGLGYKIDTDGTAILNQARISGEVVLPNAGMTNYGAQMGNANYLINSDRLLEATGGSTGKSINFKMDEILTLRGKKITISVDIKMLNAVRATNGRRNRVGTEVSIRFQDETISYINAWKTINTSATNIDERISATYSLADKPIKNIVASGIYIQDLESGYASVSNVKLEEGEVATPWCPHKSEQFNYVRMWAGSNFQNRNNAPFRVYQNGDVFAANGTFTGLLRGTLDSGDVQIYDNAITLHNPGTETEVVSISSNRSVFDTDLSIGNNKITYSKGSSLFNIAGANFRFESPMANLLMDVQNGALGGLNIFGPTGGQHVLRGSTSPDKAGALIIDSEGGNGPKGDVVFMRKNGAEDSKITVDGELNLKTKLTTPTNGLELRFEEDGWGFYAI